MIAIAKGKPAVCTIDRAGADVAYVASSDNRGAGSWVGNKLSDYPDGTRILFTMAVDEKQAASKTITQEEPAKVTEKKAEVVAKAPKKVETKKEPVVEAETVVKEPAEYVSYKNCSVVRAAGKAPLLEGEPGYSTKLDRDRDGVACE